jgi:hypothetical protein
MKKKKTQTKDRIDALVDTLDKYVLRFATVQNELDATGNWTKDQYDNMAETFETPSLKSVKRNFFKSLEKAEQQFPGLTDEMETAADCWRCEQSTFPMLLGYVLGLRIAGMSSEQTKKMARTWRLGLPQDDAA